MSDGVRERFESIQVGGPTGAKTMPTRPDWTTTGERALAVLAWLWLLVARPFLTDVACNLFVGGLLCGTWVLLALAWLLVGLVGLRHSQTGRSWWLAAIAGCLGVGLTFTDAGLVARMA